MRPAPADLPFGATCLSPRRPASRARTRCDPAEPYPGCDQQQPSDRRHRGSRGHERSGVVVGLVAVPGSVTMDVVAWLLAIAVPAIAVSFLVGIGRWHLFVTAALRDANARLQRLPSPRDVRDVLAEVFEDRQLQIGCGERSGYPASQIAPDRDGR
jgi:hypothetical protein